MNEIKKSNSKSKKSISSSKSLNNKENILLTKSNSKIKNNTIDVNKTINFNNETTNLKLNLIPNENNFISTFQSTPSLLMVIVTILGSHSAVNVTFPVLPFGIIADFSFPVPVITKPLLTEAAGLSYNNILI